MGAPSIAVAILTIRKFQRWLRERGHKTVITSYEVSNVVCWVRTDPINLKHMHSCFPEIVKYKDNFPGASISVAKVTSAVNANVTLEPFPPGPENVCGACSDIHATDAFREGFSNYIYPSLAENCNASAVEIARSVIPDLPPVMTNISQDSEFLEFPMHTIFESLAGTIGEIVGLQEERKRTAQSAVPVAAPPDRENSTPATGKSR